MKKNHFNSRPHSLTLCLIACLALLLMAHSRPIKITPAPGATVGRSLSEIRLTFAEPVMPNANITVLPADSFTPIAEVTTQQDPNDPTQIFAPLPALEPGTYTVQWQIESQDGHFVSGFYSFALTTSIWSNSSVGIVVTIILALILIVLFTSRRRSIRTPKPLANQDN